MRKIFLSLVLFLSLINPFQVRAQASLKLLSLQVDLWPEFDQPSMLVIYDLTLSPDVLPADLTLRIPASVGKPNAVAARQADGSLINIAYDQKVSGEWVLVEIKATAPELRLEYYDPGLVKKESARHFEYRWPEDYAVDSLIIKVQQPFDAGEMKISPTLGNGVVAEDGLTYYTAEIGALTQGQAFALTVDYQKASDELSSSSIKIAPSAPIPTDRVIPTSTIALVLGVLGVFLIIGGGVWYWQSGRKKPPSEGRRSRHKPSVQQEETAVEGHIYCHQCGKRATPGDRFCRTCGTQLRTG